ncbi:MAG: d(CMP) kinase [Roseobacter sp.]
MVDAAFTIAIDGPAAAGKGTISKAIAAHFGFEHLDTGLLYRAVGAQVLSGRQPITAARELCASDLKPDDLRTAEVAQSASRVAVIPEVRAALLDFQRSFARRAGGAVLDGRDIGTVICPEAEAKLFVTASAQTRARRRFDEFAAKGDPRDYEQVLADVVERDARDRDRAEAPLRPAVDAVTIDTTDIDASAAIARAIEIVNTLKT